VYGLAAAAQEVGCAWRVKKSGAFLQGMRRFVFCVRVPRTWQLGGEKAERESTKKNRPNFRWNGFFAA
jgi:hypothetical protein